MNEEALDDLRVRARRSPLTDVQHELGEDPFSIIKPASVPSQQVDDWGLSNSALQAGISFLPQMRNLGCATATEPVQFAKSATHCCAQLSLFSIIEILMASSAEIASAFDRPHGRLAAAPLRSGAAFDGRWRSRDLASEAIGIIGTADLLHNEETPGQVAHARRRGCARGMPPRPSQEHGPSSWS